MSRPGGAYSTSVLSPDLLPSPLHHAAERVFPHASLRGLLTFAPPDAESLVDIVDGATGILLAINAAKITRADPAIVEIATVHVGYPDGIGAVLALRRKGIPARRVPGADVWLPIIDRYAGGRSFYLIGGTDEVVRIVAEKLVARHPGLRLWFRSGYVHTAEREALAEDLRRRRPDFVFVAMGSPRQEILMQELYAVHPAVYFGLGGSFDIYAGKKTRAPAWLRRVGLEGAYRLMREPRRLGQLPTLLRFVGLLVTGRL